jgi:hypothetical protein
VVGKKSLLPKISGKKEKYSKDFKANKKFEAICKKREKMFQRCLKILGRLGKFIKVAQQISSHFAPFKCSLT